MSKDIIFGSRTVIEAILAGREIEKIWIQKGASGDLIKELRVLAQAHRFPVITVPQPKINQLAAGRNHQGVLCFVSSVIFASLDHLIDTAYRSGRSPALIVLDRITDVRNFGAIARTAECLGFDGLIIGEKGNAPMGGDAMKTSAGALNHLPVCRVKDVAKTIYYLKECGIAVVALTEKAQEPLWTAEYSAPVALLIGSEENGISEKLLNLADKKLSIPIQGKISSLNASVAGAIAMYELMRQRNRNSS